MYIGSALVYIGSALVVHMPRRRNSKLTRAIRAAVFEEIRVKQRELKAQSRKDSEKKVSDIADKIRQAEEIVRAVQDQRPVHIEEPNSSAHQVATGQQEVSGVRKTTFNPEIYDDVLQIVEDEPIQ